MPIKEEAPVVGDFKKNLKQLISEIQSDPSKLDDLTEEEVRKLRKEINPYSHIVGLTGRKVVLTCYKYGNRI